MRPPDPPPRAAAAEEPLPNGAILHRIDVAGVVATDLDDPIVGRRVVLVDARGARHDLLTDEDGGFVVPGITAPYDLAVAPAKSGGPTTVHLTLHRGNPWVELSERDGPTPPLESQTIRVAVRAPACHASPCWVTATTASPSGSGTATAACDLETDVTLIDVEHRWRGLAVPPGERIAVHVLVGNEDRSSFAYSRVDGVAAAPGETTSLGVTEPAAVPASEPVTIGAKGGRGALTDWRWSTSVFLVSGDPLGPANGFLFAVAPEASTTVRFPLLAGVKVSASAAASHPRGGGEGGFHRSAEVWSGKRDLTVDPIELEIAPGPEIVRPASDGTLSRRGLGFAWRSLGIAALSTLTVADTTRGSVRFRVMTAGEEVSFARLAQLGLPKLELGDHVLDLWTYPGGGAEDAVSPDSALRRRRTDRSRAGVATYLRVPFQVTR